MQPHAASSHIPRRSGKGEGDERSTRLPAASTTANLSSSAKMECEGKGASVVERASNSPDIVADPSTQRSGTTENGVPIEVARERNTIASLPLSPTPQQNLRGRRQNTVPSVDLAEGASHPPAHPLAPQPQQQRNKDVHPRRQRLRLNTAASTPPRTVDADVDIKPLARAEELLRTLPKNISLSSLTNQVSLSDGLRCVDYHPTFRALAIGSTRQLHVLQVIPMVGHYVAEALQSSRGVPGINATPPEGPASASSGPLPTGHSPFVLLNTGSYGNLNKVERVSWYPSIHEATLAFIQPGRVVTILFDAIKLKENGSYIPQQRSVAPSKGSRPSAAEGGASCARKKAGFVDHRSSMSSRATPTSSTVHLGGGSVSGMQTPMSSSIAGMNLLFSHNNTPHDASLTGSVGADSKTTEYASERLPIPVRTSEGLLAKGLVEQTIDISSLLVDKIVWDPHHPYTLALSSSVTHFELWQVPMEGRKVHAPQCILRPRPHNTRSTVHDIAFSPADPNLIIVITEEDTAGQVLLYDRRSEIAVKQFSLDGSGLSACFHPLFSDLLAVCFCREKTKLDTGILFMQATLGEASVITPLTEPTDGAPGEHLLPAAIPSVEGLHQAAPVPSTAVLREHPDIPHIDHCACFSRMRWRPSSMGRFKASPEHSFLTLVPSAETIADLRDGVNPSTSSDAGFLTPTDLVRSQLWFASAGIKADADLSVWDAENAFFPICSVKNLTRGNEQAAMELVDFVWLNELTLVSIFKGGSVVCTSFVSSFLEGSVTEGTTRVPLRGASVAAEPGSPDPQQQHQHPLFCQTANEEGKSSNGCVAEEEEVCLASLPSYQRDPHADLFTTFTLLPTSSIASDLFGHSFAIRNTTSAVWAHYLRVIRRDCGRLIRRLSRQVCYEAEQRLKWSNGNQPHFGVTNVLGDGRKGSACYIAAVAQGERDMPPVAETEVLLHSMPLDEQLRRASVSSLPSLSRGDYAGTDSAVRMPTKAISVQRREGSMGTLRSGDVWSPSPGGWAEDVNNAAVPIPTAWKSGNAQPSLSAVVSFLRGEEEEEDGPTVTSQRGNLHLAQGVLGEDSSVVLCPVIDDAASSVPGAVTALRGGANEGSRWVSPAALLSRATTLLRPLFGRSRRRRRVRSDPSASLERGAAAFQDANGRVVQAYATCTLSSPALRPGPTRYTKPNDRSDRNPPFSSSATATLVSSSHDDPHTGGGGGAQNFRANSNTSVAVTAAPPPVAIPSPSFHPRQPVGSVTTNCQGGVSNAYSPPLEEAFKSPFRLPAELNGVEVGHARRTVGESGGAAGEGEGPSIHEALLRIRNPALSPPFTASAHGTGPDPDRCTTPQQTWPLSVLLDATAGCDVPVNRLLASTLFPSQRNMGLVMESFVLSDAAAGWSYTEKHAEEEAFVRFALEWDMGYELALAVRAFRHARMEDTPPAKAAPPLEGLSVSPFLDTSQVLPNGGPLQPTPSSLKRAHDIAAATHAAVAHPAKEPSRAASSLKPEKGLQYPRDWDARNVLQIPLMSSSPHRPAAGCEESQSPRCGRPNTNATPAKASRWAEVDGSDGGTGWGTKVPVPTHREVDEMVAALMESNARVCERISTHHHANDDAARALHALSTTTNSPGARGVHGMVGFGGVATAVAEKTSHASVGDQRAQWWRAAAHAWRSHHVSFIISITTQQLEYAALMGDVQYCLVLYILFCFGWLLHREVADAAYRAAVALCCSEGQYHGSFANVLKLGESSSQGVRSSRFRHRSVSSRPPTSVEVRERRGAEPQTTSGAPFSSPLLTPPLPPPRLSTSPEDNCGGGESGWRQAKLPNAGFSSKGAPPLDKLKALYDLCEFFRQCPLMPLPLDSSAQQPRDENRSEPLLESGVSALESIRGSDATGTVGKSSSPQHSASLNAVTKQRDDAGSFRDTSATHSGDCQVQQQHAENSIHFSQANPDLKLSRAMAVTLVRSPCVNIEGLRGIQLYTGTTNDMETDTGDCTPELWKVRALQWLETYTGNLYARQLCVPLNELLLIMPEVFQEPTNSVQPRAQGIASEKRKTYIFCGRCKQQELWSATQQDSVPAGVRLYDLIVHHRGHVNSSSSSSAESEGTEEDDGGDKRHYGTDGQELHRQGGGKSHDDTTRNVKPWSKHSSHRHADAVLACSQDSEVASSHRPPYHRGEAKEGRATVALSAEGSSSAAEDSVSLSSADSALGGSTSDTGTNRTLSSLQSDLVVGDAGSNDGAWDPQGSRAGPSCRRKSGHATPPVSKAALSQRFMASSALASLPPLQRQHRRRRHRGSSRRFHNADTEKEERDGDGATDDGTYYAARCTRPTTAANNAICRSCHNRTATMCVICEEVVEGVFLWLRSCGHGGHVHHLEEWLRYSQECPKCGILITQTWKDS